MCCHEHFNRDIRLKEDMHWAFLGSQLRVGNSSITLATFGIRLPPSITLLLHSRCRKGVLGQCEQEVREPGAGPETACCGKIETDT
jgi:hypothetical protein